MDVDHDFRKEGMLFDGSNDTRSTPEPPVTSEIILKTEHLVGRCLGMKCQLAYNKKKKEGRQTRVVGRRGVYFHLAILGGSQVVTQS